LKVQSKGSSTCELILILLKQGVDEGSNATTWWSTYLGCNTNLVLLWLWNPKTSFFLICIFSSWKQNKYSLFVMTLWVRNMVFIIYEMQFGIEMFVDMFLKIILKISYMMFILPHKINFFHYLHLQLKQKILTNIWCQNSMQI
jgi:hypothetical protein